MKTAQELKFIAWDIADTLPVSPDPYTVYLIKDGVNYTIQIVDGNGLYLTQDIPSGTVLSVTGDGVNNIDPTNPILSFPNADEVDDTLTINKFVTQALIDLVNSALQAGDNISSLVNDSGYLTSFTELNDLSSNVTWVNVPDINITQTSILQHQAALAITESQITDLNHFSGDYNDLINQPIIPNNYVSGVSLVGNDLTFVGVGSAFNAIVDLSGYTTKVGTPFDNQIAVWTGDGTIEGNSKFTWDGNTQNITLDPSVDTRTHGYSIERTNGDLGYFLMTNNTSGTTGNFLPIIKGKANLDQPSFTVRGTQFSNAMVNEVLRLQFANDTESGAISDLSVGLKVMNWSTPLLTILGDGTSTFVNNISALNLSGTNTGDQDISAFIQEGADSTKSIDFISGLTQAEFDALPSQDPNTLYIVEGDIGYKTINANYTTVESDDTIDVFTSGITITLGDATTVGNTQYDICNSSGGDITIDTTSAQTIYMPLGTVTTVTLSDGEALTVQSTDTNWRAK